MKTIVSADKPNDILKGLIRAMERGKKVLVFSTYVPDRYRVELPEARRQQLAPLLPMLREQMIEALEGRVRRRCYRILGERIELEICGATRRLGDNKPYIMSQFSRPARDPQPELSFAGLPIDKPVLIEHVPGGKGRRFELSKGKMVFGRGQADIIAPVTDAAISRRHASISRRPDGQFVIEDLKSSNGVSINGRPTKTKVLEDGDIIDMGPWRIEFVAGADRRHTTLVLTR
jgi:hypothetical protein